SNSFTGGLQVTNGLLQLASPSAVNPANNLSLGGTGTIFQLNGNSVAVSGLSGSGGGIITNNSATPATFTVNNSTDGNDDGIINDGAAGGILSFVKTGPGRLTLNGSNTYTGTTTVNGGTLTISGGGTDGTLSAASTVTGNGSGTLAFNRS